MKDDEGRVLIKDYYKDAIPFTESEKLAFAKVPSIDKQMQQELGIAQPEKVGTSLFDSYQYPSLNINGIRSADVGEKASNVIPTEAAVTLDLRQVLGTDYLRQQEQKNLIISKLHSLLERYLLRRTKREVALNLPPKVEALVYTPLTKVQLRLLRALQRGTVSEELKAMDWVSREDPSKHAVVSGLNAQMNLRKICVHPYFFAEPPPNPRTGAVTDEQIITSCGKMKVLDRMLRKLRKDGHKVLIFSQFKTMIEI
jgi:hypothetical protein